LIEHDVAPALEKSLSFLRTSLYFFWVFGAAYSEKSEVKAWIARSIVIEFVLESSLVMGTSDVSNTG